jgi:Uma2 family endonuclease
VFILFAMSAQLDYPSLVDREPLFFTHRLPTDRLLTWDDLQTIPDDARWAYELIEGTLIVAPNTPSIRHQLRSGALYTLLRRACPPDLVVVTAPVSYVPAPGYSLQPDLMVVREPMPDEAPYVQGPPVLVVEVLSPSTRRKDQTLKRSMYQQNGIEHYWLVDPAGPSIQALRLVGGAYQVDQEAGPADTFAVSAPIPVSFEPRRLLERRG